MPQNHRILLCIVIVSGLIVYGVSFFPPLTTAGTEDPTSSTPTRFDAVFSQELAHCQKSSYDVNCRCFADISGTILAENNPRVPGVVYANKQELARGQAMGSCLKR